MIILRRLTFLSLFLLSVPALQAQDDIRRSVAVLQQEMDAVTRQVGALRLEVEALRSENARLRQAVEAARAGSGETAEILAAVDARLSNLRTEMTRADDENRRRVVSEVRGQITQLAEETQSNLQQLAAAVNARPGPVAPPVQFDEDYPKTGLPYVVQPGDTISGLAQRFGSRTEWIRNANKIVDPSRDLRVGQNIFIPQPAE